MNEEILYAISDIGSTLSRVFPEKSSVMYKRVETIGDIEVVMMVYKFDMEPDCEYVTLANASTAYIIRGAFGRRYKQDVPVDNSETFFLEHDWQAINHAVVMWDDLYSDALSYNKELSAELDGAVQKDETPF